MRQGQAAVVAARACVGARFRVQGRAIEHGLDCLGVVARTYGVEVPHGYALRGGDPVAVAEAIEAAGFVRVMRAEAGDLLLMAAGAGQLHFGVWTGRGLVHAHAGLRKVVETPGAPAMPVLGVFRPVSAG